METSKLEPQLAAELEPLPPSAMRTALVVPQGEPEPLRKRLDDEQRAGRLRFNFLSLTGHFAVEATKATMLEMAQWPEVEQILANRTFSAT